MDDRKKILRHRQLYNTFMEKATLPEFEELKKAVINDDEDKVKALMSKSAQRIDKIGIVNPYLGKELSKQQLVNFINKEQPEFKNLSNDQIAQMIGIDPKDVEIIERVIPGARGHIRYFDDKPSIVSIDPDLPKAQKLLTLGHEFKHEFENLPEPMNNLDEVKDVMGKFTANEIVKDPVGVSQRALKGHHVSGLFEFDNLRHLFKTGKLKAMAPFLAKAATIGAGGLASLGAEAAQQIAETEPIGATRSMPEHYLETGTRDPEEARQKALAYAFKESLEGKEDSSTPSRFEKPEIQKYKEDVLKANKEDLLPNYVEELPEEKKQNFNKLLKILR